MNNRKRVYLSPKQEEYLKSILKGYSSKEVINLMKDKYNIELTIDNIKNRRRKYNIKREDNPGQFKKHHIPHNKKEIGEEVYIKCTGKKRWFVKTKNRRKEKGIFITKERYIYEKYIDKIPKGYKVIHLNGNLNDFDLDNLYLVKQNELFVMGFNNMFTKEKELTKTNIIIADLILKMKDVRDNL